MSVEHTTNNNLNTTQSGGFFNNFLCHEFVTKTGSKKTSQIFNFKNFYSENLRILGLVGICFGSRLRSSLFEDYNVLSRKNRNRLDPFKWVRRCFLEDL